MKSLTRHEAEDFLYREARMMDDRQFDAWLGLFAPEAHYWIPTNIGADPRAESAIAYYDRDTLDDWVFRLKNPAGHAQAPPSRIRHIVSNVEVESPNDDGVIVYSNFVIHEFRSGEQRTFAGNCEHHLSNGNGG